MSVLAVAPALAPGKAAPYVIAAYVIFLALVLTYVTIMAVRLVRAEREVAELRREVQDRDALGGDVEERELETARR